MTVRTTFSSKMPFFTSVGAMACAARVCPYMHSSHSLLRFTRYNSSQSLHFCSAMPKTILLVSRDENLQNSHALVLERVGYRTIKTGSLTSALQLSSYCQMSIIGHTFSPQEQDDFIDRVHEGNPSIFVLCLRFGVAQPQALLTAVANCFAAQPGGSRVCIMEESNISAWPQRASFRRPANLP